MAKTTFLCIGGFLGSGKTTTLKSISQYYESKGKTVALITNDAAENLVDTKNIGADDKEVEEVTGGCFCCEFHKLTSVIKKLMKKKINLDMIIAEPIGSCTDLVATVVQPLLDLYNEDLHVAPFVTLVDPIRAESILTDDEDAQILDEKVIYIMTKQLEEADAIVLNKIDRLSKVQQKSITNALSDKFDKKVIPFSARKKENITSLIDYLEKAHNYGRNIITLDYDKYADGEAMLGWLNATVDLKSDKILSDEAILKSFFDTAKATLKSKNREPVHLKALIRLHNKLTIASLVANADDLMFTETGGRSAELVINARVQIDPEETEMGTGTLLTNRFQIFIRRKQVLSDGARIKIGQ